MARQGLGDVILQATSQWTTLHTSQGLPVSKYYDVYIWIYALKLLWNHALFIMGKTIKEETKHKLLNNQTTHLT